MPEGELIMSIQVLYLIVVTLAMWALFFGRI